MSTNDHDALKASLEAFARRLDARVREFKDHGEFSDAREAFIESMRKRQASLSERLEAAIRNGMAWDVIKCEIELGFDALMEEFVQLEEHLDAEMMKQRGTKR
jgi:hypothetical protein